MLFPYFLLMLLAAPSPPHLQHFRRAATTAVPNALIKQLCSDPDLVECSAHFRAQGRAWKGDINGDGMAEYVLYSGESCGTLGCTYSLYQRKLDRWFELPIVMDKSDPVSMWQTNRARFDILPTVRDGYHDLRIAVDQCVKWDGRQYVPYAPDDYHHLSPALFDASDSYEAEIFWMISYAGMSEFVFTPRWFPISRAEFLRPPTVLFLFSGTLRELPHVPTSRLDDSTEQVIWIGLSRGGVWGVRGNRGFLLAPQQAYLGAQTLKLNGDWLSAAEGTTGENPQIEYNRRTHILRIVPEDYSDDESTSP